MDKRRIIFVRNSRGITDVTGAESYLFVLAQGLLDRGHDVKMVCTTRSRDPSEAEPAWLAAAKTKNIPLEIIEVPDRFSLSDFAALPGMIRNFNADVVHSIDHRADIVGLAAARRTGRPLVSSCFGWTNWSGNFQLGQVYAWLDRRALLRADQVITDSRYMANELGLKARTSPIAVIPNGVNVDRFNPSRADLGEPQTWFDHPNALIVGMVGRIHPNKGQLDLAEAAAKLVQTHPHLRFLVIGDAPTGFEGYKDDLMDRAERDDLKGKFVVGNVSHQEVPAALDAFDILVAPSYIESCSFSILEGMAMARPIIASDAGGNPEIIEHLSNGLLFATGDESQLADRIKQLADEAELRGRLGKKARQDAETQYSIGAMVDRTLDVYDQACRSSERLAS